jgi:hypothetical protein
LRHGGIRAGGLCDRDWGVSRRADRWRGRSALAFVLGWAPRRATIAPPSRRGEARCSVIRRSSRPIALIDTPPGATDLALQVVTSGLRALPGSPELADRMARLQK